MLKHATRPALEGALVNKVLVRVDCALDQTLAQAPGGLHQHDVRVSGLGVERESHAAGGHVTADHLHHCDCQGHAGMGVTPRSPVGDCAVVVQRGLAVSDGLHQRVLALHVQNAVVLAREARPRQIFGGSRTAHGDRYRFTVRTDQRAPGSPQRLLHPGGHRGLSHQCAGAGASLGQRHGVGHVERVEQPVELALDPCLADGLAVGFGGQRKAGWNTHAHRCARLMQFTDRCCLAAHLRQIA